MGPSDQLSPQRTAFFTSAAIFFSSAAVNSFSAKEVGHMAPSSRLASSSKPNVAYLELNFPALLKKQTTLPSLAYAGIPYQVFGHRVGAVASMIAWSRLAIARSGSFIAAIAASRSRSPSSLFLLARASAFSSWARAFIAARSSAVNPLDVLSRAVALFADFCVTFVASFFSAIAKHSFPDGSAQLVDADQVARGIAEGAVADPVRLIRRFIDDLVVGGLHPLEGAVEVGRGSAGHLRDCATSCRRCSRRRLARVCAS